jgi:small subunit ribosomal protein S27Ae
MQLFVKTGRTHVIEAASHFTVSDVKAIVAAREGLSCDEQRVLYNGKQLEDDQLLSLAGVQEEATLQVLGRLLGGAKKRKKKTYTKPKKIKHKHKNIKLRVLKFYQVDGSGKVQRKNKQCPQCGPGTFMAEHFDRVYCGKCATTFVREAGSKRPPAPKPKEAASEAAAPAAAAKGKGKGKK